MPTLRGASDLSPMQSPVPRREGENVQQNNLKRKRSARWEVKLLMEMKAVGHPLRGASDLSQRQTPVSTGQNNLKRGESGEWEVKLLKELKSEVPTLSGASGKIILNWERALGSQIIKENEIRGAYAERRKRFITDASTSVEERRGKMSNKII